MVSFRDKSKTLTNHRNRVQFLEQAEVAELADALRSGRSESILMWVQVPPSALNEASQHCLLGAFLLLVLMQFLCQPNLAQKMQPSLAWSHNRTPNQYYPGVSMLIPHTPQLRCDPSTPLARTRMAR